MKRHNEFIQKCFDLALQGSGFVSPNPLVGAVIVDKSGQILAEGYHKRYGESHAEVNAVENFLQTHEKQELSDKILYINLEPCNHFGKTPPCVNLILEMGIKHVVCAITDPYEEVSGKGIERLRANGVKVETHILQNEAKRLNEAFIHKLSTFLPLVTLKIAQTIDASVATNIGDSKWISHTESRKMVHQWRAAHDAVLIGVQTALLDNPKLTIRDVPALGRQPYRIILDRCGILPPSLHLFTDEWTHKTVVFTAQNQTPLYANQLTQNGGKWIQLPEENGHLNLHKILHRIGEGFHGQALNSVLVEGGGKLSSALLAQDLVDRLFLFIAPKISGGHRAMEIPSIEKMNDAKTFAEIKWQQVGDDMLFMGYLRTV